MAQLQKAVAPAKATVSLEAAPLKAGRATRCNDGRGEAIYVQAVQ